ncbi:hypothetical protein [Pelagibius sp. Alg239-R121]|uniref:hypothetical protein n=1 Tax=Pelagibius sp. Alg239-R121 TaxID=2993448 RepID=UPI0024A66B3C|nr:hypothetical protein [Pelagibius sp. Alg239-R121]
MRLISIAFVLGALLAAPASATSYSDDYWRTSDTLTKRFICTSHGATPDWCEDLPGRVEVPKSIAGVLAQRQHQAAERAAIAKAAAEVIAAREGVITRIKAGLVDPKDVEKLIEQAKAGENEAMELIAWMYAQGLAPKTDDEEELNELAYIWYGKAYLAGAKEVKENMDKIWPTLNETQQNRIVAMFDRRG